MKSMFGLVCTRYKGAPTVDLSVSLDVDTIGVGALFEICMFVWFSRSEMYRCYDSTEFPDFSIVSPYRERTEEVSYLLT